MSRVFSLFLLIVAIAGLFGQSTAVAMSAGTSGTMAMSAMECDDMSSALIPGSVPCKKMTLQCIAVMGCPSAAMTQPASTLLAHSPLARLVPSWPSVAPLDGRFYGPEPDPPSFLV